MFKNFFIKIKYLLRIKIRFDLPKKNFLLLYDEVHSSILKEIIKKKFNILKLRDDKEIYFFIFIKQIFLFDFTFKTYCINYIKFTSPKVVITLNEARIEMYELKKYFKKISFIAVQNGIHMRYWFDSKQKLKLKLKLKNLQCDYIFLLNKHYIPKYQKLIKSNYDTLGHFRNNFVKIKKTKFKKQFLLISQIHNNQILHKFHTKLLYILNIYLTKKKKKLHILLRRNKKNPLQLNEINFYKKVLKSNCIFYQSSNWKTKYKIIDKFENIVFTHSTMGFEAIARKKKVAIFPPKVIYGSRYYFGWPASYEKKNDYLCTSSLNYNSVSRVLDNVYNCSQANWNTKYYKIIKDLFYFDQNNKKLRKLILKLIKIKKI